MFSYTRKHAPLRVLVVLAMVSALLIGSFSALAQPSANVSVKSANQAVSQPQVSTNMVVNEIQVSGPNGASDEFIELYNRGNTAYDLNGHRVVYRSAAGVNDSGVFAVFTGTQSIPANGYFLICSTNYNNVAICDSTYNSGGMAATGGGVGLRNGPNDIGTLIDSVGYGNATNIFREGTAVAAPASGQSAARTPDGTDSDNNLADFTIGTPSPRNSNFGAATPTATVTAGGPTSTATTIPSTPTASPTVTAGVLRVHDIQTASHISPYSGTLVSNVPGIVTAKRSNGFYLQDPNPDANDATSEAVFVFTSSAPTVNVGDSVLVSGTVKEFRSTTACNGNGLTTTELDNPGRVITVISSGNPLPAPITIGIGGRVPPNQIIEDDASGDVETSGTFDPATDGIDFYESMEAMRVQLNNPVTSGPTSDFGSNRELATLADNGANAGLRTSRGGVIIQPTDFNPERVILNDVILRYIGGGTLPVANVGDQFSGSLFGVMDYSFCNFKFQITQALPTFVSNNLPREVSPSRTADQLSVATFNVKNLAPSDPITKFNTLAGLIVNNMKSPDVISVEEVQDNSGATNDGTVDASLTYAALINAITNTTGGPLYDYRQINPVNNQDGGQPGGNIRQGFLFRTDRDLSFVDRPGGGSTITTTVQPGPNGPELSFSPGRIDPNDPAWSSSRKPLAGEFMFNGQHLFVIANHFNSKGGDQSLFGHWQPPVRSSEVQRAQQATHVHDFSAQILALDPNAKIVVLGDINDFWFSNTLNILKGTPQILNNLIETQPLSERYTYDFEGNSQDLDQILASNGMFSTLALDDPLHVNAEYGDQASDHDPHVALFNLPLLTPTPLPTATATPNLIDQIIGSTVLTEDLQLSSVLGVGSLNAQISGQNFGTGGYLLFNYDGNTNFVGCNPPGTPCPPSPNSNDRTLLSAPFSGVNISITRASGISNPITQTQSGGSAFIDNGPHKFSGIYDTGPNGNGQTLIIQLTNLPTTPFRITVYDNNNPGGGSRSGFIAVTNGGGNPTQFISYGEGGGEVSQWLVSGSSSLTIIQTQGNALGNAPVGGILFDNNTVNATPTTTPSTPTPTQTATPATTSTATATPSFGTPTATPTQCSGTPAWVNEPPMNNIRSFAGGAATNGKFYVISGYSSGYSPAAEGFDPSTGTWANLASIPTPHSQSRAAAVGDHIYVPGGFNVNAGTVLNLMQVYTVSTNTWGQAANLPAPRSGAGVAALNGKVYIAGGTDNNFNNTNTLFEYDPATNSYATKASMPMTENNLAAVAYGGKLYAFGGGAIFLNYVYDPSTNTWSSTAAGLTANFQSPGGFALNGEIYLVGGSNGFNPYPPSQQVQIYNVAANSWHYGPVLNTPRDGSSAAASLGSKGYIAGGDSSTLGSAGTLHRTDRNAYTDAGNFAPRNATPATRPAAYTNSVESITSCGGTPTLTATQGSATATATSVPPTATATSGTPNPATPTNTAIPATSTPVMTVTMTGTPAMTMTDTPRPTDTQVPTITPTDCPNPFVDINGNVFYPAIHFLYCRGIVNGTDATHYGPAGTATRAQFAKVVVLGFAIPAFTPTGGTSDFTDVPNSYYAYAYIETGYHASILSGYDAATCAAIGATFPCYGPNRPITRAQLTKLVVAAGGFSLFTPTSGQTFTDVGPSNVFFTYIETAAHYGIVGGYIDGTFRPNNNIRRDEMAQIVYKGITTPPLR